MRLIAAAGLAAGIVVVALLVAAHGIGPVWQSTERLGWGGLAAIVGYHLALVGFVALAWWRLEPRGAVRLVPRFGWARLVRESGSALLPLSQIGGYVCGARALTLAGLPGAFAAASTVVDVTVEVVAQLGYTLLGLALLYRLRPHTPFAGPILLGVAAMAVAVAIFIAVQARGAGFVERAAARLTQQFLGRQAGEGLVVQAEIRLLHGRPRRLAQALGVHCATWLLNGVETWLTLRLMGAPLPVAAVLAVDSLMYGLRSVAFMVPGAMGVQEGALILLGGLFGLPPDTALALSLVKRARDVATGLPALLGWQVWETRAGWAAATRKRLAG